MQKKAIVLLSGGLDSITTLALAKQEGYRCYALSFDYGQRHTAELNAAAKIASDYQVEEHKIISLGLASALTFDDPIKILLPPATYFLLAVVEGIFIMLMALGRSFALNPVIIFIWLIFWGWVWGVVGAVLAVPLLAILKIICDHFKALSALSEFLGKESKPVSL